MGASRGGKHQKTLSLSWLAVIFIGFFLYDRLSGIGEYLLGLLVLTVFFVLFLLADPFLNRLTHLRRIRFFDEKPYVMFFLAAFIVLLISGLRHALLGNGFSYEIVVRFAATYSICGILYAVFWPYFKRMELSVDVKRVGGKLVGSS